MGGRMGVRADDVRFIEAEGAERLPLLRAYARRLTGATDDFFEEHLLRARLFRVATGAGDCGFFCLHDDAGLTALSLPGAPSTFGQKLFERILQSFSVTNARVATCDEPFLSLALDFQRAVSGQAYFFREVGGARPAQWRRELMRQATLKDVPDILEDDRAEESVRAGKYFVMRVDGAFVGQGFCNPSELKPGQASIGMHVHPDWRRRGVGRSLILHLAAMCHERGVTPVCGCWYYNDASRRTLESAGFASETRYLNVAVGV